MRSKFISFFATLFLLQVAFGQEYKVRSAMEKPDRSGFYRIPVTPDLGSHVKTDLSDLRIFTGDRQVPYIKDDPWRRGDNTFELLPVLKNTTDTSGTTLILDAARTGGLDNLSLVIANTAAERTASLSGSDDGNKWFIIHENLFLSNTGTNSEGQFLQSLRFPFTRYRQFKLVINKRGTDPINVLAAGVFQSKEGPGPVFEKHSGTVVETNNTSGKTHVFIKNPLPYVVDRIEFGIAGPKYYDREVKVFGSDSNRNQLKWVGSGRLVSNGMTQAIDLPGVKSSYYLLEIANADNPPLQITTVSTMSQPRSIIAWLEKDKEYQIFAGNDHANLPQYDLSQFRDSIPTDLPTIGYGSFIENTSVKSREERKGWLWPAIIGMIAILGFLTFRLMREMKNR